MLRYVLSIGGIILGFLMIKERELVGDALGNPDWARKFGGIYTVVVFLGVFFMFWAIAALTNTTEILFKPLELLIPGLSPQTNSNLL